MRRWEKIMVFVVVPVLGIISWSIIYIERGWVRQDFISAYVTFAYQDNVNNTYDTVFFPVNIRLAQYGFAIQQNSQQGGCGTNGYEGFYIDAGCSQYNALNFPRYSKSFERKWHFGEAMAFNRFMESQGWSNVSPGQPLLQLYAPQTGSDPGGMNVNYRKKQNGVQCNLMIGYDSWEKNSNKAWAEETCREQLPFSSAY